MEKRMYINKSDVEKIIEIMDKFPNASRFKLIQNSDSGIGSVLDLEFTTFVNGVEGTFTVEIAGSADW